MEFCESRYKILQIHFPTCCKSEITLDVSFEVCKKVMLDGVKKDQLSFNFFVEDLIACKCFLNNFFVFIFWENMYEVVSFLQRYSNLSFNLICESYRL